MSTTETVLDPLAAAAIRVDGKRVVLTTTTYWHKGSDNTTTASVNMTVGQALRVARDLLSAALQAQEH
jgi:hypothetical protein